jgi:rRNA maturation endonuclease Nob1
MNIKECDKCYYRTLSSIEQEQRCKYCGGLLKIIAKEDEKTN